MPKLSVIIPTYNRENYLFESIQSVLEQTYKDFEIIVVDDGSTDNTKSKLEVFNSNNSKLKLIEQKNSERAVARNNGIKNASGEYIAFLDSDDIWTKDKLKNQVEILDSMNDVVLVYGQSLRINEKGQQIKPAKRQLEGHSGSIFEKLLLRNFITSTTPLIRKDILEKTNGFQSRFIPYEDWEFWLRLSLLGKFYFLQQPIAFYRVHKEQSVKLAEAKKIESVTTQILENSFLLKNIPDKIKNKSLGLANLRFCYWYLIENEINKAREKIQNAINLYPNFILDPRWYGLNLLSTFPQLKGKWIFNLEQYH